MRESRDPTDRIGGIGYRRGHLGGAGGGTQTLSSRRWAVLGKQGGSLRPEGGAQAGLR